MNPGSKQAVFSQRFVFCQLKTSLSSIGIVKPFNIILFQVLPYLYLDDFEWDFTSIFQAMSHTVGNIGTLVFADGFDSFVTGNSGGSRNDNPVL